MLIISASLTSCYEAVLHDAESDVVIEVIIPDDPEGDEDSEDTETSDSLNVDIDGGSYEVEPGETITVEDGLAPGEYTYYILKFRK